jgi:hypothetical protein
VSEICFLPPQIVISRYLHLLPNPLSTRSENPGREDICGRIFGVARPWPDLAGGRGVSMQIGKSLLAVGAFVTLTAASGYMITPSTNRILPAIIPISPGQDVTVAVNDIVHQQPVGQSYVAILEKDVSVTVAGMTETVPKGASLNVALVSGGASQSIADTRTVFCLPSKSNWNLAKGVANLATLSLFARSQRHDTFTQFCLVDTDGDSAADQAFLAGAKRNEDQKPVAIEPAPISVSKDVPLPGLSVARIRFAGKKGMFGLIAFDLEVIENGVNLLFQNGRTMVDPGKLPQDVRIFGASFTVQSYDKESKTAKITFNRGFTNGQYQVTTTTTYIPVYIP